MNELRQAAFHRAALPEALPASPAERRRAALWPIATFAAIAVFLGIGLTMNPREFPHRSSANLSPSSGSKR